MNEGEEPNREFDFDLAVALGLLPGVRGIERRAAVESLWRRIADGTASKRTAGIWARHVAKELLSRIVDSPTLSDKHKGSQALWAVGLFGRRAEDPGLLSDLDWVIGTAEYPGVGRQAKLSEVVRWLSDLGHFKGVPEKEARRKVQHMLKVLPPD